MMLKELFFNAIELPARIQENARGSVRNLKAFIQTEIFLILIMLIYTNVRNIIYLIIKKNELC